MGLCPVNSGREIMSQLSLVMLTHGTKPVFL